MLHLAATCLNIFIICPCKCHVFRGFAVFFLEIDIKNKTLAPTVSTESPGRPTPETTEESNETVATTQGERVTIETTYKPTVVTTRPGSTRGWHDKDDKMCGSQELASVFWPKSPVGKLVKRQCPHGKLGNHTINLSGLCQEVVSAYALHRH